MALLYAACSHLAFWWFDANGIGPTFFPAAGLTLGLLVLLPRRSWPWVLLGAAIAELTLDLIHDLTPAQALGFVLANTAEPLAGAASIRAAAGDIPDIRRRRGLMIFIVFGVLVAPIVGGAIGATTDELFGSGGRWLSFAAHWWIGDGLGILVVGGAIVSWALPRTSGRLEERGSETAVFAVMAICLVVLEAQFRSLLAAYLIAILVGVAAFRLGTKGVAFVGTVLAFSVATAAANGYDFFGDLGYPAGSSPALLQSTVLLVLAGALVLAAEIFERDAATERWTLERAHRENAEVDAARERSIALRLQRSMLGPERFDTDDVSVSCLYRAGSRHMTAGGDWHDVIELADGTIGLTVGDVVGHGIEAASVMAQLRVALAAIAAEEPRPGAVIQRLEAFAAGIDGAEAATLVYATLDPSSGSLSYACAGHPPPVLVTNDGSAALQWDGRSPPLCVGPGAPRSEGRARLEPGETLVLYTDGLVERRGEPLDAGLERVRTLVEGAELTSPDGLERVATAMAETGSFADDVAILAAHRRGLPLQDTPSLPMGGGAHE